MSVQFRPSRREFSMMKSLAACALALMVTAPALVSSQGQTGTDSDAVAAVTRIENDAIKAALANDSSFYEKFLASDDTGSGSEKGSSRRTSRLLSAAMPG